MTCLAPLVVLPPVALRTGSRTDLPVDHVLAQVVSTMRQVPLGRAGVLVARFDLLLVCMTVGAERILMTGGTRQPLVLGVKTMLLVEVGRLVIEGLPLIGVALAAIRHARNHHGVFFNNAGLGKRVGCAHNQGKHECANNSIHLTLPSEPRPSVPRRALNAYISLNSPDTWSE